MKTAVAQQAPDPIPMGPGSGELGQSLPLGDCVRNALRDYFEQMADYEIKGLHALVIEEVERPLLESVLEHSDGNLSQASRVLGLTRSTLRKRLLAYGIDRP